MKANCWMGRNEVEVNEVPDPRSSTPATPSCGSRRPRSAAPTCTCTTATCRRWRRATSWATSSWARSSRSGRASTATSCKVGDRVVVPFPIACGACPPASRALLAVREHQPQRGHGREAVRPPVAGHLRLLAPHRRLRRRPGRVRPGAVRRRRAAEDRDRPHRRAGAVPVRHPAHRLHGRRDVRHQPRRRRRGLGRRPGRPVRDGQRPPAGRRARSSPSTRRRTGSRWPQRRARRRSTTRTPTSARRCSR